MRMQAAIMFEQGKPRPYATSNALVIEDVELEGPGPGEVLIEVAASGHGRCPSSSGMRVPGSSANAARASPT
jgi:Zn-dependent alcohol dehydrogenase